MTAELYYRIEKDKLPVGDKIDRNGDPPLTQDYPTVETILENRRPPNCLSRSESVNMRKDRDFTRMGVDTIEEGYVHHIEPLHEVECRDVEWIGALQKRYPKSGSQLHDSYRGLSDDELADQYWQGKPSKQPSFEYATKEAKVVCVESKRTKVRRSSMTDALEKVRAYDAKNSEK